ncbi:MAG: DUF4105 domain-containing protein [Amylibacter sp.]|nr:DUF4105 domain-containing protein [Amylibacter sp.]
MSILTIVLLVGLVLIIGCVGYLLTKKPSLSRNWSPDQELMPSIDFLDNGALYIKNIRNAHYRSVKDYDIQHHDKALHLEDVQTAWLAISPFAGMGAAHAFLSFGLKDGTYIAVSIEVRRKKGQRFTPVKAFTRQFEIMYVIATETDIIRLRTNHTKHTVRLFPLQAEKKVIRDVFIDVLKRADKLGKEPEFYNTVWNNCTTNIIRHARRFSQKPIPFWNLSYLFPESLDKIAYRLNIIDTHLPYEATRDHFDIKELAMSANEGDDFSAVIRSEILLRPVD